MSACGDVEAMFAGIENLREGIMLMQQEIDRLKAENEALKAHMLELQAQVEQAKRYIESCASASATSGDRGGRMDRILPHDRAAEETAIKAAIALEKRRKGGI